MNKSQLDNDIEFANNIINNKYFVTKIGNFDRIYPFTTENIDGYASKLDLKNKKVLTVGSSCDHIFDFINYGAKDITCIDINPFVKYYYELKKAAIKVLSRKEFLEFFCYEDYPRTFKKNNNVLNIKSFNKIYPYLNDDAKKFWSVLYSKATPLNIRKELFSDDEDRFSVISTANAYLHSRLYKGMPDKFKEANVKFENKDIFSGIIGKYDFINLSNISTYIEYMYDKPCLDNYKNDIEKLAQNNLNSNGQILFEYLYDTTVKSEYKDSYNISYNIPAVIKAFKKNNIMLQTFTSIKGIKFQDSTIKDTVMILKKR